jgi:hypothetical protein
VAGGERPHTTHTALPPPGLEHLSCSLSPLEGVMVIPSQGLGVVWVSAAGGMTLGECEA